MVAHSANTTQNQIVCGQNGEKLSLLARIGFKLSVKCGFLGYFLPDALLKTVSKGFEMDFGLYPHAYDTVYPGHIILYAIFVFV